MELTLNPICVEWLNLPLNGIDVNSSLWVQWLNRSWNGIDVESNLWI